MTAMNCSAQRPGAGSWRSAADSETTLRHWRRWSLRAVLNAWCDRFPSGWIGRRLVPLFIQAGLGDVVTYPRTLVLRELDVADQIYSFMSTAEGLAKAGTISRADADRWTDELRAADAEGRFFSSYTGFLVSGTRLQ